MSKRPNILFLMSDQHRADIAGFAGNGVVYVPTTAGGYSTYDASDPSELKPINDPGSSPVLIAGRDFQATERQGSAAAFGHCSDGESVCTSVSIRPLTAVKSPPDAIASIRGSSGNSPSRGR